MNRKKGSEIWKEIEREEEKRRKDRKKEMKITRRQKKINKIIAGRGVIGNRQGRRYK